MTARIHVRSNTYLLENELVTGEVFSPAVDMQYGEGIAFQVSWNGSTDVNGELTVECSVDGKNFCTFAGSNVLISGTSGGHIFDIVDTHVRWLRVRIGLSSGSSYFSVKENLRTREM